MFEDMKQLINTNRDIGYAMGGHTPDITHEIEQYINNTNDDKAAISTKEV